MYKVMKMNVIVVLVVLMTMGCVSYQGGVGMNLTEGADVRLNDSVRRTAYSTRIVSLDKEDSKRGYCVGLDAYAATHVLERATADYSKILSLLKYSKKERQKLLLTVEYGKGIALPRIVAAQKVDK